MGPPGFHTTAREPKCAHFTVPALQKHQQNSRKDPKRERKKKEIVAGGGKKERNFGRSGGGLSGGGLSGGGLSAEGCPAKGCPAEGCPAEGGFTGGGVQRKGPSEMGCRVLGFGFSSGFWTKTETEQKQNEERGVVGELSGANNEDAPVIEAMAASQHVFLRAALGV